MKTLVLFRALAWVFRRLIALKITLIDRFCRVMRAKKRGGPGDFTCCVPGCFTNSKRNLELSFYNFPNGKHVRSKDLRKKWIDLIARKDFSPSKGHRVYS